ncbi:MAG: hypothetical protein NTW59_02990 [Candidatus Diapherotrites archaeon]|nr:hypothetical protein [Candidatus Diapherotrites archaeon]
MDLIEEAVEKAKETMRKCSTPHGLHASGGPRGYNSVWARDSMIGLIGASTMDPRGEFKQQFRITLNTLRKYQTSVGQIPNCVDMWDKVRPKKATFATTDSTLLYLLGLKAFAHNYNDKKILRQFRRSIDSAFCWLRCQDAGEDFLPEQLPTCDWQDCFPHKYGHTINTVALYYAALRAYGKKREMRNVLRAVSGRTQSKIILFNNEKGHFYPWVWKNHDGDIEQEEWFDSLGNMIAICGGLADRKQAAKILRFVKKKRIDKPYPVRVIYPPIKEGDKEWHSYFGKCLAATPHYYINGGIWPFVGGFYVAGLAKAGKAREAKRQLIALAKANRLGKHAHWEFNEWIHPLKRKAMGSEYHAWDAGAFLLAAAAVQGKKLPPGLD